MKEKIAEIVKRIQLGLCPENRHYDCNVCTYSCSECWTKTIESLISEREKPMREALVVAKAELTIWLDCLDCDCPAEGHICGRPRVEQSLAQIDAALKEGSHAMGMNFNSQIIEYECTNPDPDKDEDCLQIGEPSKENCRDCFYLRPKKSVEPTCPACGCLVSEHKEFGCTHEFDEYLTYGKFGKRYCTCKYAPADLQPERQVSRDFDTIEHESEMPLREQFHRVLSRMDKPTWGGGISWNEALNWMVLIIEAHDSAVASKAVKEFVEKVREWKQVIADSYKSPMPVDRVQDMLDDLIASVLEGK